MCLELDGTMGFMCEVAIPRLAGNRESRQSRDTGALQLWHG